MGIRGRLLILAIGVAVPLAIIGALDLRRLWSVSRLQLDDSVKRQAELAAIAYERWIDAQQQPLATLAAVATTQKPDSVAFQDYLRYTVATRPHWFDARVVDADGHTLAAQPASSESPPPAVVAHLLTEAQQRNSWALTTDRTGDEAHPLYYFAAPVERGGIVIARVDGARVSALFRDIELSPRAVIAVFDADGRILYRRQTQETPIDAETSGSPLLASLGSKRTAIVEIESPYDGVRRVYGLARAGATNNVVIVGIPSAALYESARRQRTRYLWFSLLALACAIAAALVIARGVARPVQKLREAAQAIGAGDFNARAPVSGGKEIGELGASFNQMAAQIKEREERLAELDHLKSEFVSSVSHELRTPLTTIKTLTHVLQHGAQAHAERQMYLATIAQECDRQIDFVADLLDLSRIEAGAFHVSRTRVNVHEVVRACYELSRHHAEARDQTLEVELPAEPPDVLTDQQALRRVLRNLIENAVKYTPHGGRIIIAARTANKDEAAISVTDTGCGIAPEDVPCIFEKFYRARPAITHNAATTHDALTTHGESVTHCASAIESSTANEAPGVGLGLYLARGIVEQLGARIAVESRVKNDAASGTIFTVFVPLWQKEWDVTASNEEKQRDVEASANR